MQTLNTIIPPQLLFSGSMLYANHGNICELEVASGMVRQIYSIPGVACAIIANDVLYLNRTPRIFGMEHLFVELFLFYHSFGGYTT